MCNSTTHQQTQQPQPQPRPLTPCPVNLRPGREWTSAEWEQIRIWLRDGLVECLETQKVYFCECGEMKRTCDPYFADCKFCGYEHQGFECEACEQLVDPAKWWEHSEEICNMRWQNARAREIAGPRSTYTPYAPAVIDMAVERNKLRYTPGTARYQEAIAEQVADAEAARRVSEDIRKAG